MHALFKPFSVRRACSRAAGPTDLECTKSDQNVSDVQIGGAAMLAALPLSLSRRVILRLVSAMVVLSHFHVS